MQESHLVAQWPQPYPIIIDGVPYFTNGRAHGNQENSGTFGGKLCLGRYAQRLSIVHCFLP